MQKVYKTNKNCIENIWVFNKKNFLIIKQLAIYLFEEQPVYSKEDVIAKKFYKRINKV